MPYLLSQDLMLAHLEDADGGKRLGPYILVDRIGQGGMGAVYRARHEESPGDVAVKCLFPAWAREDPTYVQRFLREIELARELSHPNLVATIDSGSDGPLHYLVMEYVAGITLGRTVRRGGPLDLVTAVTIAHAIADAVALAHARGVVHRDIKPDNVLVTPDGRSKLTDLGLAKATRQSADPINTASGVVLGSLPYMPPEQQRGLSKVGPPGDVYALGATLFFMLAGRAGLSADVSEEAADAPGLDIRSSREDVPETLAALIARATHHRAERRHQDAFAFARDLAVCLAELGAEPPNPRRASHVVGTAVSRVHKTSTPADDEDWTVSLDDGTETTDAEALPGSRASPHTEAGGLRRWIRWLRRR
jgi:serine/threonine protein kinase